MERYNQYVYKVTKPFYTMMNGGALSEEVVDKNKKIHETKFHYLLGTPYFDYTGRELKFAPVTKELERLGWIEYIFIKPF